MTAARRQGGISLLEVLVAFAIMALSLGVLMQIFGSGARAALRSEDYTKAVLVAQSALELFDLVRWEELGSERRFVLTSLRLRRPV